MNPLNKIVLTGLSVLSLNNLYSQDEDLDTLLKECDIQTKKIAVQIKTKDNLINEQLKTAENLNYLIDFKRYAPIFSSRKIYSENVCINLNDTIYHVTKKNEEEGLNDLIKLNNDYEEAWLYLPEKQTWYEIGIFSDSKSVKPFTPRIREILKENPDVKKLIFYHNHPSGCDQPSSNDLIMAAYLSFHFFPDYKISNKIIAKDTDVIEYSLNLKGKRLLEDELKKREYFGLFFLDDTSKYFDINCTSTNSGDKIK